MLNFSCVSNHTHLPAACAFRSPRRAAELNAHHTRPGIPSAAFVVNHSTLWISGILSQAGAMPTSSHLKHIKAVATADNTTNLVFSLVFLSIWIRSPGNLRWHRTCPFPSPTAPLTFSESSSLGRHLPAAEQLSCRHLLNTMLSRPQTRSQNHNHSSEINVGVQKTLTVGRKTRR